MFKLIWQILSIFGDIQFWLGAAVVSLIFFFIIPKKSKKYIAWFVFLILPTVSIAYFVTYILKILFKVERPCLGFLECPSTYSFPSSHAAVVFAAATAVILLYKNKKLAIPLLIISSLVSLSRVMLDYHRFEDIIAGALIGIIVGIIIERVYRTHNKEIAEIITKIK